MTTYTAHYRKHHDGRFYFVVDSKIVVGMSSIGRSEITSRFCVTLKEAKKLFKATFNGPKITEIDETKPVPARPKKRGMISRGA